MCVGSNGRSRRRSRDKYESSCSSEREALRKAVEYLRLAQDELRNVEHWLSRVRQAVSAYQTQAQRLYNTLQGDTPRATALLERSATILSAYVTTGAAPSDHPAPMPVGAYSLVGSRAIIQEVPLDQIDLSDSHVHTEADFQKTSRDEMVEGWRILDTIVRPAAQAGADHDYFRDLDQSLGLDPAHGYQDIYDAFYADHQAITLEKVGDTYKVINGYHRLAVAVELGIKSIPAKIVL